MSRRRLQIVVAFFLSFGIGPVASAGDRALELLLVNMVPDAAYDDSARDCLREVIRGVRGMRVEIHRIGETRLLEEAGREDPRAFMQWPMETFRRVVRRHREEHVEAMALVDCRPSEQRVDVAIYSPDQSMTHARWRHSNARALANFASYSLDRAWLGQVP